MSEELSASFGCMFLFMSFGFFVLFVTILLLRGFIKREFERTQKSLSALHKKLNRKGEGMNDIPAFPTDAQESLKHNHYEGMTLRQYAAIHAMQGLLATSSPIVNPEKMAIISVNYSDALLKELERERKDGV